MTSCDRSECLVDILSLSSHMQNDVLLGNHSVAKAVENVRSHCLLTVQSEK